MFTFDKSTTLSRSTCDGCISCAVCKWKDKVQAIEQEIKNKGKVNRETVNPDNDVYSILDIRVSCKYYRSEVVNRLGDINIPSYPYTPINPYNPITCDSDSTGKTVSVPRGVNISYTGSLTNTATDITSTNAV